MGSPATYRKFRYLFAVPCFFLFSSTLIVVQQSLIKNSESSLLHQKNRRLLATTNESSEECIPSGIHSFPEDFFTQEERQKGGVLVHFLILSYVCAMIAVVCDVYFIPSLEIIADKLKLPPDVAGATFMAIGASSPELFSSIIGSFVTEGDIGVGAVIGSAVFNILGITGVAGIALWNEVLDIDWYPMVRDCIAYSITVLCLVGIIYDNIVTWWESVILLGIFFLYILLMYFNTRVEKATRNLARRIGPDSCLCRSCQDKATEEEKTPLLKEKTFVPELYSSNEKPVLPAVDNVSVIVSECTYQKDPQGNEIIEETQSKEDAEDDDEPSLCSPPRTGVIRFLWWLVMWPASLLLTLTIPDSSNPKCIKAFPLTFLVSIAWLGVLSYMAVWMVTVIGYTLSIPDSVSGLTILAVGASVPDLISSVLVAKSGQGNMAISNLVGSNNFDISICLGVPWLGKTLLSGEGYLRIYSTVLSFAVAVLLITLFIFFMIFQLAGWKLNRMVGLTCLLVYALYIIFACLFEFNVFGYFNPPTCYP
ncbi:sodium/potassium/calcium exchanger 3-like [Argiope bruennichi]|uniref:sodium/potassium/calcium exchanger 3-like n=1 Tax=Argiope bruennichi TaxID=94029 RepID=UPI0024956A86|nr:sodium/potassium/calcium exchanger 3-like [Argiope bruennichi]